jgi:hypothetical protein
MESLCLPLNMLFYNVLSQNREVCVCSIKKDIFLWKERRNRMRLSLKKNQRAGTQGLPDHFLCIIIPGAHC